jgi:hypothetical protein
LYFKKFVLSKSSAERNFKRAVIRPTQGPETFLRELQMLGDVSGLSKDKNYESILRQRFCRGLANAHAYSSLPFFGRTCKNVDEVLSLLEEEELLDNDTDKEISYEDDTRSNCPYTKSTFGYHNRISGKRTSLPSRQYGLQDKPTRSQERRRGNEKSEYRSPICNNLNKEGWDEEDYSEDSFEDVDEETDTDGTTFNMNSSNNANKSRFRNQRRRDLPPTCTACQSPYHNADKCYAGCRNCRNLARMLGDKEGEEKVHKATEVCPLNTEELKKVLANPKVGYPLNF